MDSNVYAKSDDWNAEGADSEEEGHSEELTQLLQTQTEIKTERSVSSRPHTLSVVGETLVFKGDLTAEEDLLIQGKISGSITHRAQNLTIGASGDVRANIVAQHVIIQGKVRGDVRASESIVVEASARVEGNLYAPCIGLKEGAKFKGSIDMDPGSWEQKKAPDSASADTKPKATAGAATAAKKKSSSVRKQSATESQSDEAGTELSDAKVDGMLD